MIITFANHKGGVGKTALALVTAETLIANNAAVEIFDFDPQKNLTQQLKLNGKCVQFLNEKQPEEFDKTQGKYTVIDTAPGLDAVAQIALSVANVIVVPIETDISAIKGLNFIINFKPNAKIIIVINKFNRESKLAQQFLVQIKKEFGGKAAICTIDKSQQLQTNINTGKDWNNSMRTQRASQFFNVIREIIKEG